MGKLLRRPCVFDQKLANDLKSLNNPDDDYEVVTGTTMCTLDFYEGQARLDGAFCGYDENEKQRYLRKLQEQGVKNFEMEAVPLSALTYQAGIRTAAVCVTCIDRLQSDQIKVQKETFTQWEKRPQEIVTRFIKKQLNVVANK